MAGYLSGNSRRALLVGVVAISVISFGAATVTDSLALQGDGFDLDGGGTDTGTTDNGTGSVGSIDGSGTEDDGTISNVNITTCVEPLNTLPGAGAYFGLAILGVYGLKRRYSVGTAMLTGFGVAPFLLVGYFLMTDCPELGGDDEPPINPPNPTEGIPIPDVPPLVLVGVLGVVLLVAAAAVVRATGDQYDDLEDPEDEAEEAEADVSDLAAAAGAAADRLEKHNADVDNAVYRAWWEMTQLLDVPEPDSWTPGQFADAAVEVGMSRDHVEELTTLFEEVRYGRRDPEGREDHAVEVFRTIEEEYGEDVRTSFDEDGEGGQGGDRR